MPRIVAISFGPALLGFNREPCGKAACPNLRQIESSVIGGLGTGGMLYVYSL